MNFNEIKALDESYVVQTYGRNQVAIDHGHGATLWDTGGKEYIDFTSGIGVCSLGYANEAWAKAIYEQAMKVGHISNLFYTEPYAKLASKLVPAAGMAAAFFGNSGAEANEGMIKVARKYSYDKYGEGRAVIITLKNSFHGRTITTLKATGQDHFHEFFFPFTEGFRYAEANSMDSLMAAAGDDVCGVMMELIQGEGGVNPLNQDYVQAVAKLCAERDWLLLVDEVQTGVGRTGSMFAYQQFGIQPDVISFAKGIAGGLPFGGFMTNEKCRAVLKAGDHGSTFGGNPMAAAAANVVMDTLTPEFLAQVTEKGQYLRDGIASLSSPIVSGIRGMGLMIGVGVQGMTHKELKDKLMAAGLLCLTAGKDTLRLLPPLSITTEEIDKGLEIMAQVMK
ncbi:MAG: acetylornithine/succinylornithine family transaminase [Oscillospiraceae bacterium]|jgi:acetylornithine/N-succinyldiaminopimelate aminotransferase|nr:acetylornithine/succinylornithine family transaminase [Oscillospiraceae bacterium]MDE6997395.1 acetylornithine/succinylornithine family transaminase [Oscillospiraceae bacterium]